MLFAACGNSTPASNEAATTDAAPAAAQSEEAAPQPETLSDKTLTVVLQNEPTALTGLLGSGTESGLIIMDTMVNTLYRYEGETRQAVPALASGYETIDELHYRFTLRDDACYSDGTPVKAQDVVYSFTKYAEPGVANASYFDVEGLKAEDDQHVIIAFKIGISIASCRIDDPLMTGLVAKASSSDEATSAEGFNGIVDYVFNNFCLRGLCTESKYCVVRRGIQGLSASSRMGYLDVGNAYEAD